MYPNDNDGKLVCAPDETDQQDKEKTSKSTDLSLLLRAKRGSSTAATMEVTSMLFMDVISEVQPTLRSAAKERATWWPESMQLPGSLKNPQLPTLQTKPFYKMIIPKTAPPTTTTATGEVYDDPGHIAKFIQSEIDRIQGDPNYRFVKAAWDVFERIGDGIAVDNQVDYNSFDVSSRITVYDLMEPTSFIREWRKELGDIPVVDATVSVDKLDKGSIVEVNVRSSNEEGGGEWVPGEIIVAKVAKGDRTFDVELENGDLVKALTPEKFDRRHPSRRGRHCTARKRAR